MVESILERFASLAHFNVKMNIWHIGTVSGLALSLQKVFKSFWRVLGGKIFRLMSLGLFDPCFAMLRISMSSACFFGLSSHSDRESQVFGGERLNYGRYKEGLPPSEDWAFATCVKGQA